MSFMDNSPLLINTNMMLIPENDEISYVLFEMNDTLTCNTKKWKNLIIISV